MLTACRLWLNAVLSSVRVMPDGVARRRMQSANGLPMASPKTYRADASQYCQTAIAAARCCILISFDLSSKAYKHAPNVTIRQRIEAVCWFVPSLIGRLIRRSKGHNHNTQSLTQTPQAEVRRY